MTLQQVELFERETRSLLTCWIETDPRIRQGTQLTLKELPDRTWIVVSVYKAKRESEAVRFQRGWHVGGL